MSFVAALYRRFAHLAHELAKFGTIGIIGFVMTIGISDVLHLGMGVGPLTAFGVATAVATTFSYFANRYWTFRHRDNSGLGREYLLFFVLSGVGLVITWLFIGLVYYGMDVRGGIPYNASQIVGTAIATLFRYWSYKKWVFLPATAPPVDPHTGLPEAGDAPGPAPTMNGVNGATEVNGQAVRAQAGGGLTPRR